MTPDQKPSTVERPVVNKAPVPRVLSIAGTDPTGGAGMQADLKSIAANGGYGMGVVTAVVAQNTCGVRSVHQLPARSVSQQLSAVSDDVIIDAIKIGMLQNAAVIEAVSTWLERTWPPPGRCRPPVVLDPVMSATSGDRLLDPDAERALLNFIELVDIVTPNLPELARLAGQAPAQTWADALQQGRQVSKATGTVVLVKGGHLPGRQVMDALVDTSNRLHSDDVYEVPGQRVATLNTHGTGCSLSSALATQYARTGDWVISLERSKRWLLGALSRADDLEVGRGAGPIHHFAELWDNTTETTATSTIRAPITETWWDRIRAVRESIGALCFVRGLREGSLSREMFAFYLTQDAIYLERYARVLSRASQLAPNAGEQAFWARCAVSCIDTEQDLHRAWLDSPTNASSDLAPVTVAYTDHLLAVAGSASYSVLVAAVLPCFWLYSDLGERLASARNADHPFGAWIDTYADPSFHATTWQAREIVDHAAGLAGPTELNAMWDAFSISVRHEVAFFGMNPADEPPLG